MQEFFKKNSTSIIVGLVTTIVFLYILQPLLELVGTAVIFLSAYVSSTYIDILFIQIAHMEIMDFGFFFYLLFFSGPIGISIGLLLSKWKPYKEEVKSEKVLNKFSVLRKKIITTIFLIITILFCLVHISTKAYQLSLISSFKQHMKVIAPYIDEQTEEFIISEWSLMKNSSDYDDVYYKLNKIAKTNNIELPENRVYSLDSI
jgi:hypothetical protein